jgi:hypothetical protein
MEIGEFDYFVKTISKVRLPGQGRIIKKKELRSLREMFSSWTNYGRDFLEPWPPGVQFSTDAASVPSIRLSQPVGKIFFSDTII